MFVVNQECVEFMKTLPSNCVDAIVTDPPYGLSKQPDMAEVMRHWLNGDDYEHKGKGFMGKAWDSFVPGPSVWRECMRVLKPGGHMVVFAGSRTYDLMCLAIRLANFEIRDQLMWVYGSGFPKSLDISKALDKAAGEKRESINTVTDRRNDGTVYGVGHSGNLTSNNPITAAAAAAWDGWGTALKPAHEPIVLARKPLDGTVAANVLTYGVGGLNINGRRVGREENDRHSYGVDGDEQSAASVGDVTGKRDRVAYSPSEAGRFPANFIHDGSPEAVAGLGETQKYFYCAKASKADRNAGCDELETSSPTDLTGREDGSAGLNSPRAGAGRTSGAKNVHPTVKPTELMRWLCRLITPVNGTVLDPFTGSGSTGRAAFIEGFNFMGCELDSEYCAIANARIKDALLTGTYNKG